MILVDASVWIDYFNGMDSAEVERLDLWLGNRELGVGDLTMAEVLQGFRRDRDFDHALHLLNLVERVQIADDVVVVQAARHYRRLRSMGVTTGSTIDALIATRCITSGLALLHRDRDFDPYVATFGLRDAMLEPL